MVNSMLADLSLSKERSQPAFNKAWQSEKKKIEEGQI